MAAVLIEHDGYADAGIPRYWIVDLGAPTVLTPLPAGRRGLRAHGRAHRAAVLDVAGTAGTAVTIDLVGLTRR